MVDIWCAQHRDGWCAMRPNRKPAEGVFQVKAVCDHFICLPWGIANLGHRQARTNMRRMQDGTP